MKKSRRFAPYGDKDGARTYKNIVPAPPKGSIPPLIASTSQVDRQRSPKRKREEENETLADIERPGNCNRICLLIARQ